MVVKSQYLCFMRVNNNLYWDKHPKQHVITVTTRTILHTRLEVNTVTGFNDVPKSVCDRAQGKKYISRHPIYLTDYDYYYILEEISRQYKIEFEIDVEVHSNDEGN